MSGDFETATSLAAEKDVVNEVTGIRLATTCDLLLAGYRGRPAEAEPLFTATIEDAIGPRGGIRRPESPTGPQRCSTTVSGATQRRWPWRAGGRGNLPALEHAVDSARTDRGRRANRTGGPGRAERWSGCRP